MGVNSYQVAIPPVGGLQVLGEVGVAGGALVRRGERSIGGFGWGQVADLGAPPGGLSKDGAPSAVGVDLDGRLEYATRSRDGTVALIAQVAPGGRFSH